MRRRGSGQNLCSGLDQIILAVRRHAFAVIWKSAIRFTFWGARPTRLREYRPMRLYATYPAYIERRVLCCRNAFPDAVLRLASHMSIVSFRVQR